MEVPVSPGIDLLWIDLGSEGTDRGFCDRFSGLCRVHYLNAVTRIAQVVEGVSPDLICFEFDCPDLPGLTALKETKLRHPSVPILMLTEHHSEELAIWALRTRVWDYMVKPVKFRDFTHRLNVLSQLSRKKKQPGTVTHDRHVHMPPQFVPIQATLCKPDKGKVSTQSAISYVDAHFHEKVMLNDIARMCEMGPYQFSRAFKRDHGLTFREFLIRYRINKSLEYFKNPKVSVIDIAYAVGYNDPSHFTRTFRQYVGITPSAYRASQQDGVRGSENVEA